MRMWKNEFWQRVGKTQAAGVFFASRNEKVFLLPEDSWEIKVWSRIFVFSPYIKMFRKFELPTKKYVGRVAQSV